MSETDSAESSLAYAARLARVREMARACLCDTLVVTYLPNVRYLTGFAGSAAAVVVGPEGVTFLSDGRYRQEAAAIVGQLGSALGLRAVEVETTYDETLAGVLRPVADGARVGIEADHLPVARYEWLAARVQARPDGEGRGPVMTTGVVESCRLTKDSREVALLREGGRRLSAVAVGILADLRPGVTELEVALSIELAIRRAGFERPAFETIVASGPGAALPHARPGGRRLEAGDLVLLDFGGVYGGYCVDLSRTVSLGTPTPEARRIHQAVLAAQQAALAVVGPGRPLADIDRAARRALAEAGLEAAFTHGTGHGLGLEIHEAPRLSKARGNPPAPDGPEGPAGPRPAEHQAAGMVFTLEPGAYVPGWGGVRIEDDVLVTADGVEVLTSVPSSLELD